jgi:hypothetical protein
MLNRFKEAKMKYAVIIIGCAVLVLGITPIAMAVPNSNSIVQYGIEYYIQTDKPTYDLGENVEMLFRITNLTDANVTIVCSKSPWSNFYVQEGGETIWMKVHGFYGDMPPVHLSVGESVEIPHIWDMIDDMDNLVEPGIYDVVGVMYNQPWNYYVNNGEYVPTEVAVPITIVPEPSSLAILLGGMIYFTRKRKSQSSLQ